VASIWVNVAELYADKKNDLPAGLAALHRAKNLVPGHVPTLMKLADLYTRDGQWSEAVDRLTQVIGHGPADDVLVEAHVRLAAVLDEHLGDAGRRWLACSRCSAVTSNWTKRPKPRAAWSRSRPS
jgi:hypothetical protein